MFDPKLPNALKHGFLWSAEVPGVPKARMLAGTRVPRRLQRRRSADPSGDRRSPAASRDVRHRAAELCGGESLGIATIPARLGIRESRHAECLHTLTEAEVLNGTRFPDAIANGSYRVDIHYPDRPGLVFRYLDGTEEYVVPGQPTKRTRWRPKTDENPTFYQIPYRCLVPRGTQNVLVAGRMLDADRGAFGGASWSTAIRWARPLARRLSGTAKGLAWPRSRQTSSAPA